MEQLYFTNDNKKIITDIVLNALSNVMPKNTIDMINVQNVILNNMKNIIRLVDSSKINNTNFKDVLQQINKHAVQTSLKQLTAKDKTNIGAIKFQRDNELRNYNNTNSFGDRQTALISVERPLVASSGSKDLSNSLEALMAERESLDNMIGVKKSVTPGVTLQQEITQPSFTGITNDTDSFSDLSTFGTTITSGVNINETNFESFDQRYKRLQSERDMSIKPSEEATKEFQNLMTKPDTAPHYNPQYDSRPQYEPSQTFQPIVPSQNLPSQTFQPIVTQQNLPYNTEEQKHVHFSDPLVTETITPQLLPDEPTQETVKTMDSYTNTLNAIITKEKIIDEKLKDLEKREKQFMELQIIRKDIKSLFNFNFQHIIIDSRTFEQTGLNAYLFNFNNPIKNVERIQILNISIPVINYNIASKQYFEYLVEEQENSIHIPRGNYNINQLIDLINNRNTDGFKLKLNSITDCLFIESKKNIKVKNNTVSKKLGLENNIPRPYDLRIMNYLTLYIRNIFQEKSICKVNPYNFTPIDIIFNEPLYLDKLEIEFRDNDDIIVDFEGRHHLIEMRIFYSTQ